jgi:hypothetical protein
MFKRTILALAVAALAVPGVMSAQENATLILKSGERVTGQLLDHGGVGFTVRVNGQERQVPTNDVSIIDFAGNNMTTADWAKVTGGTHVIWLRNGQTINGQFYDIGGSTPLRVTVKTEAGDREFSSSEIGRIVLAPMNANAAVATSGTIPEGQGIAVPGNQQWTATGLTVRRGEVLTFNTTGEVQLSPDASDVAHSAGARSQRYAAGSPLPRNFAGALIARIGNGEPFPIGDQTSVTMPAAGQLFLGINDDGLADNQGGFRVQIQRSGRRR